MRRSPVDTVLRVDAPLWLVSQWSAEFETDRRVYSGELQLIAPGSERVLDQRELEFDFRHTTIFRFIHRIRELRFVGVGTYEFHVLMADFAEQGEWGQTCLRVG